MLPTQHIIACLVDGVRDAEPLQPSHLFCTKSLVGTLDEPSELDRVSKELIHVDTFADPTLYIYIYIHTYMYLYSYAL